MSARHLGRVLAAVLVGLTMGLGGAWELRIDERGGPADLAARVEQAVVAWREAGVDVEAVGRVVAVRYGDAELMGPDALTLVVTGGPPGVDLEILVRADAERLDEALLVAVGIALGGRPGSGALAAGLDADVQRRATPADVAALFAPARSLGDITGDGAIGFADLLALAAAWGERGVNLAADLDGDGVVGASDLTLLRAAYTLRPLTAPEVDPADDASDAGDSAGAASDADDPDSEPASASD